jgi:asparagine synthase (glutamine-hydrolysing)
VCGICGWVGAAAQPADRAAGPRMRETLRHRGPDGTGELAIAAPEHGMHGWLGHRRLKVIDVSESADQPMVGAGGAVALTYNGEVYNFRELRRELESRGHRFASSGDTEVVLRAYEEWGEGFVERLDGMFALAVWDARSGKLTMARDRTGKKPLFYCTQDGRMTFGSEIKALLACPWIRGEPELANMAEFLAFGYVPHPRTLYKQIEQVPPGSVVVYGRDGVAPPRRYWDVAPPVPGPDGERPDLGRIAGLLRAATERRMVADVPLGALLSGGIDSSLVVGLMSQASSEPVRTFAVGFADAASFDERSYARIGADRFGTRHTEYVVRPDAVALLDRLLWHHDQPFGDSSAIPTYLVCELAREHVTVVLNGDGGDEVFGGYDRFVAAALAERLPRAAGRIGRSAIHLLPVNDGYYSVRRRLDRFTELADRSPEERYQSWVSVMHRDLLAEALTPLGELAGVAGAERSMVAAFERASGAPTLDRILYANFVTYLPDDLAVKMDRMSMAHSLETRSPFLDTALIEYLASIPAARKVGLRRVKPLLRRSMTSLLPKEIWNRRKHGFGVPVGRWFREGELRRVFEDEVLAPGARCSDILDPAAVRRLWDEHQGGAIEHGHRLWPILTLERWLRSLGSPGLSPPRADPVMAG